MIENKKLDEDLQGKQVDATLYRDMIGSLIYLTASRPDLNYVVCLCARYQAKPTEKHLQADTRRSTSESAQFLGVKLVVIRQEAKEHCYIESLCTAITRVRSATVFNIQELSTSIFATFHKEQVENGNRHGLLNDHAKACDYVASQPVLPILP
ncbi:hypothetical protein Tco_0272255 [Tanacetum coccineum]